MYRYAFYVFKNEDTFLAWLWLNTISVAIKLGNFSTALSYPAKIVDTFTVVNLLWSFINLPAAQEKLTLPILLLILKSTQWNTTLQEILKYFKQNPGFHFLVADPVLVG